MRQPGGMFHGGSMFYLWDMLRFQDTYVSSHTGDTYLQAALCCTHYHLGWTGVLQEGAEIQRNLRCHDMMSEITTHLASKIEGILEKQSVLIDVTGREEY